MGTAAFTTLGINAVAVLGVLLPMPANAAAPRHMLSVKTCEHKDSQTWDTLHISFCAGPSNCTMGRKNAYNGDGKTLDVPGTWSDLEVPLEYEPTTMLIENEDGTDAWCIEQLKWNNGSNLLGRNGRVYIDGDLGLDGCSFGVHSQTGNFYPCQSHWRFFNLQGAGTFTYEIAVKPCKGSAQATAEAFLCSESMCEEDRGSLIPFNLTVGSTKRGRWLKTQVHAPYNPVAMKLKSTSGLWCAEDIVFNEFRIFDEDSSPPIRLSRASPERYFYNLQAQDLDAGKTSTSNEEEMDFMEELSWTVCAEIIAALGSGVLLYGFVGGSSFFRRWASWGRRRMDHESEGSNDDAHICRACEERAVARNEERLQRVERLREMEHPLQHRLSTPCMSRGQVEDAEDDTGEIFRTDEEGTKHDASVLQHLRRWPSTDSSYSSYQRLLRRTSGQSSLEEGGGATPQLVYSDSMEGQKVL